MSKYKIGDELRIREWDDMVEEFGFETTGSIKTKFKFHPSMQCLCGCDFTVSDIISGGRHDKYCSVEGAEFKNGGVTIQGYWYISEDMLEPRTEESLYIASDTEIDNLLFK